MVRTHWLIGVAALVVTGVAGAQTQPALEATARAVEEALPTGWTVAERKSNEFPWGHHWCEDYSGPKGIQIIVVGPKPVSVQMKMKDGISQAFPIAKESLELWVMPPEYRDSWKAWLCFSRPIQPTSIAAVAGARIYGRPAHRLNSEAEFKDLLSKAHAVSWPSSPWNDPATFSWATWARDVEVAARGAK
jgi:hypothetical protein